MDLRVGLDEMMNSNISAPWWESNTDRPARGLVTIPAVRRTYLHTIYILLCYIFICTEYWFAN
jgi:hypothetical protein